MFSSTKNNATNGDPATQKTARPDCSPKNANPFITDNSKRMTEQDTNHKGGRPKAVKGKARTKTISTRLTLAEWKTVMKRIADAGKKPSHFLRELLLQGKVVAARDAGGQEADKDAGGWLQQPEPVGEVGTSTGISENQRKNHRPCWTSSTKSSRGYDGAT